MRLVHIAAAGFVLAAHAAHGFPGLHLLHKRCSVASWVPTPASWETLGVDSWIQSWWNGVSDKSKGFVGTLVTDYMLPDVNSFVCSVHRQCTPICGDVVHTAGGDSKAKSAWFTLVSIANLNDWLTGDWTGITIAQTQANSYAAGVVKSFSEAGLPPTDPTFIEELLNLFGVILSVAITPIAGGLFSQIPGGIANAISISLQAPSAHLTLDEFAVYGNFIANAAGAARDALDGVDNALMQGNADAGGFHIWDYLKGGLFTNPVGSTVAQDQEHFLQNLLVAGGINALWKNDRTYIVASDSSDCQSDTRGPSQVRFCTQDVGGAPDGRVYYAYMLPDFGEPFPQPWAPIGSDAGTMGAYNLSLQAAIQSSIGAFNTAQYGYAAVRRERWAGAACSNTPSSPQALGPGFEGTFTIPVCYDASGRSITSIKSNSGRNYPCACGDNGSQTLQFANVTGLTKTDALRGWYCNYCQQQDGSAGLDDFCSPYIYTPEPAS